jgi:hypothetical protein
MAKTWLLDTETKGTGAHIVPLEKAQQRPSKGQDLATVMLERPPRPPQAPEEPAGPMTFKVLDIRSGQILGEGIDARETIGLLGDVGSVVDVRIYAWVPRAARWRLLRLDEQRALWRFRDEALQREAAETASS